MERVPASALTALVRPVVERDGLAVAASRLRLYWRGRRVTCVDVSHKLVRRVVNGVGTISFDQADAIVSHLLGDPGLWYTDELVGWYFASDSEAVAA